MNEFKKEYLGYYPDTCPLCGKVLEVTYGTVKDPVYIKRCSEYPIEKEKWNSIRSSFQKDSIRSHYEEEYADQSITRKIVIIFPYLIAIEGSRTKVSKYKDDLACKFIFETGEMSLPLYDLELARQKLENYIMLS